MMFNLNFTPEQIEQIKKSMQEETGMMNPMPQINPQDPSLITSDAFPQDDTGNEGMLPQFDAPTPTEQQPVIPPPQPKTPELPMSELAEPVAKEFLPQLPSQPPAENTGMFGEPEKVDPNLTPATPPPQQLSPYEERIQGLMEERGWDREKAEANQRYAISQGHDLNGDGIVTDEEFGSGYTSTANTDLDQYYAANGQGLGSVYIPSAGRKDAQNMGGSQRFEILQRANDKLLGEGQEWGFEEGAHGQWGTYGGPGFSLEQSKIDRIDFDRYGTGGGNVLVGGQKMSSLYRDAVWDKAQVQQGQLGQVVKTPMGDYMVVNGMDGQLALKGLKGSRHGGGNYFFSMVDEGYHLGIHPETGEVWFQQAPNVVELADKVRAAGGDFITAMTSGIGSGDLGVWTKERVERFMQYGSTGISRQMAGVDGGGGFSWTDLDWNPQGGSFLDSYNEQRNKSKSIKSLFKDMIEY